MNRNYESTDMFYFPKFENPDYILEACKSEGKDVLAIAGFGYPFTFLSEARTVKGIDISKRQILWNRYLKEIMALPHQYAKAVVLAGYTPHTDIETSYLIKGFNRRALRLSKLDPKIIKRNYKFILDPKTFEKTKEKLSDLNIDQDELVEFLSKSESESFDIIYMSSVRQWVCNDFKRRNETEREHLERFANEYDRRLAREVIRTLRRGGLVYEANVNTMRFRTMPISDFAYWELNTASGEKNPEEGSYESKLGDFKFAWTIGTKE